MSIIVITGPTATGKTALGVALAKKINGEIVSADSMQVYTQMNIGTAKPTQTEMGGICHYMINIIQPSEDYSVARYVKEATECVDNIINSGKQPIIVGGTGLYIDSLLKGRDFLERGDMELRKVLEKKYDEIGGELMLAELGKIDPVSVERLFPNDKKRIVRALEIYKHTGKLISEHDALSKKIPPRYNAIKFALKYNDRNVLYEKINKRVDNMIKNGLIDEIKSLLNSGITEKHISMQAIGYKEIAKALINNTDLDEAIEKVKMESRRYAKRQLTWFRRDKDITWIYWDDEPNIKHGVDKIMEKLYETK
ncbi:MAG: tRNA (adenosine(37)-N6)-dimethylallyltransferase MiaA [Oscillospiraceae bacterium]|jgi:tRNA dimethylallyltransferase|nr:tRNA (adenosine(37)-N6)-dimethylallyltransferase MiaA [Oscillospiraceae bacterium]